MRDLVSKSTSSQDGESEPVIITSERKEGPNPTNTTWKKEDRLIKSTTTRKVLGLVVGQDSARKGLEHFSRVFLLVSKGNFPFQQIKSINKGKRSISEYFRNFKHLCDELSIEL